MNAEVTPVRRPDLSGRPLDLVAEHVFAVPAAARLTHAGFLTAAARDRHKEAWPMVLAQLEKRLTPTGER
jgi:hypothetical protein